MVPTDPGRPAAGATSTLRAVKADDLAIHHDIVDPGPDSFTRAVVGLLLGAAVGAAAAVLTTRRGN